MEQTEVQAEGQETYSEGFKRGFEVARAFFSMTGQVEDFEAVKKLPAGSCLKDAKGRILFRTRANGWVTTAATHCSSMYVALPAEVLYHG